jgi:DNA-binding transcriptional LysR family regulator
MRLPKTSLEHWAVLAAVVDQGSFAQAATTLHKSQSAVSYAVARLQEALGVPLLEIEGRKAVLTAHGHTLLKRARPLLGDLETLERLGAKLRQGWETELRLVVDVAFPRTLLLNIVSELQQLCPDTQMQVSDAVLSGAEEAIVAGSADLVVTTRVPGGVLGDFLLNISFIGVASPAHPLLRLGRALSVEDLVRHVQVVVRDSGSKAPRNEGWLGAERRCTVSSMEASLATVRAGLGFAWLPEHIVAECLRNGELVALPTTAGSTRQVPLHVVLVRPELAGPAARTALESFQRHLPVRSAGASAA